MIDSPTKIRTAGVIFLVTLTAVVGLTLAVYNRVFANPAEVTLRADRAGLVLDPGNKVKMRGARIGRVGSIERSGDGVEIVLEIDRDQLDQIPSNVTAEIRSTTVFGAKYVELIAPADAAATRLADDQVIAASSVTTEVNTVFQKLDDLLDTVNVSGLNVTLTVLAETLQGRGDDIATIASKANAYLTKLEPELPQLRRDLLEFAEFAQLADLVSDDLLAILRNVTVTGATVVDQERAINTLLVDLSLLGGKGAEVLGLTGDALAKVLRTLRPTASTLRVHSSELPCLFQGLDETRKIMAQVIGGREASLRARVSVRSGLPVYTTPKDLPGVPRGSGPDCRGLPRLGQSQIPVPEVGTPR